MTGKTLIKGVKIQGLKEIRQKENEIFVNAWREGEFFPTEFDTELNEIQRQKIRILKEKWGKIYGVRINEGVPVERLKGKVLNFSCDAVIPCYSEELVRLIERYRKADFPRAQKMITEIHDHIDKLGGELLYWV
jgi:hypothetical protein